MRNWLISGLAAILIALPAYGKDFSKDSDEMLLAKMLYGEARSCSTAEKVDVAYTAVNRAGDNKKWNGTTLRGVILCKSKKGVHQYSCFNKNDPNLPKLENLDLSDKTLKECLQVSEDVLSGRYRAQNKEYTHYYAKGSRKPGWAGSKEMIDLPEPSDYKHDFFKEK